MEQPTFVSLFSGIGGFDAGLEQAGWKCVGQVENDPFCNRILQRHWPDVPRWGDITRLDPYELPDCDLLCGGFPCQDVSVAGRRAGLAGDRSSLFFEFARVALALRSTWLLVENVPGLFSSNKGRDFATILATLGDIGYGVAWRVLDSRYFGVAQRRRRVFLVGHLGEPCPAPVLFESESLRRDTSAGRTTRARPSAPVAGSLGSSGSEHINGVDHTGAIATGSSGTAGDGRRAVAFAWQQGDDSKHGKDGRGRSWVVRAGDYTGALSTTRHDAVALAGTLSSSKGRGWCDDFDRSGAFVVHNGQGDPNWGYEQSFALDTQAPSAVAHPLTAEHGQRNNGTEQNLVVAGTLGTSNNRHTSGLKSEADVVGTTTSAVRRLTPTECERLQAFPDGWTCLCGTDPYSTWNCACPDAPRYAALGNAVTTSVSRWIGARLLAVRQALGY